jgi:hypothetical protein
MMNVGMRSFYPIGVFSGVRPLSWSRMRRLAVALPLALLIAPAARAAEVKTDRACYLQTPHTTVTVAGTGFGANRPYTVALDGAPLSGGAPTTDAAGAMQGAISAPVLGPDEHERTFAVAVQSDGLTASTTFTVTHFSANFSPSRRVAPGSHVRFSVYGFGLSAANPDVYLHYVTPGGRLRTTIRLGRAQGQCGSIARTAKRQLFPFGRPRHGRWRLQFDTAKAYTPGVQGSPFLFYTVGVNVHAAR